VNEEVKVSVVTKAMEELAKTIADLDSTVNNLGERLHQVLSPELSISANKEGPVPKESVSPLLDKMQDATYHLELTRKHVQLLIERLEV